MMALFFSCDSGGSGGSEAEAIKLPVVGSVIPDGAYFARWNGTAYEGVLSGGDQFPATFQEKDIFLYRDYAYRYGLDYDYNIVADGWGVTVAYDGAYGGVDAASFPGFAFKDKSTFDNAGLICESINGKKIKSLNNLFYGCVALKNFVDDFAVPAGVTDLYDMFEECSSLETLPADFRIPAGVTDVGCMFHECSSLETLPAGFTVPDSVTEMYRMFYGCTSLVSLPAGFTVPDSVARMFDMFNGCTSLSGTITINTNPTSFARCFENAGKDTTDGIVLKGSSTKLDALADTKGAGGKVTVAAP